MASSMSQNVLIDRQFGIRAASYVASAVHASGSDLAYLAERIAELNPETAIDLGAGGGHVTYTMAGFARRVVACDLSQEMLSAVAETARNRGLPNIETQVCDIHTLPFGDGEADFVASRFSAHHWTDLPGALREARRILKEGSTAIFMDVVSPGTPLLDTHLQAVELLRDPSHVRDYSISEWLRELQSAGFSLRRSMGARLRLDFASWVERIGTEPEFSSAIRLLQKTASGNVSRHFAIEDDGSFTIDTAVFEVLAA
ncbi:class I SAM-dependent methyltransferase [Afifella aestuarii]|uniref:class I SAM-dependent methyltransferase n=1 Tax=Afifella aestuarii TaxID=1909496 RepID=UPI000FE32B63|nr:class I SAM-dependent methyltransferase [Afifella aestuarii]